MVNPSTPGGGLRGSAWPLKHARSILEYKRRHRERAIKNVVTAGRGIHVKGRRVYNTAYPFLRESMRYVAWPRSFTDPLGFLQLYSMAILATCGDHLTMAHWFIMALGESDRAWLTNLPEATMLAEL
jgi:hypothetical protein